MNLFIPFFRITVLIFAVCLSGKDCDARTAINRLIDIDVVRDDYRQTGQSSSPIESLSKEAGDILTTGGKFGINYDRQATQTERETIYKSVMRTFLIHGRNSPSNAEAFFSAQGFVPADERWYNHYAALYIIEKAAEIALTQNASFLWGVGDVANETYKQLSSLTGGDARILRAIKSYARAESIKHLLGDQFIEWYLDVCRSFPDVKHQWLVRVRDIKDGREQGTIGKSCNKGHLLYLDADGYPIAVEKLIGAGQDREKRPYRNFKYELACSEIAEKAGLDDVVVPVVKHGSSTFEPFIAFMPKDKEKIKAQPFYTIMKKFQEEILSLGSNDGLGDKAPVGLYSISTYCLPSSRTFQFHDIPVLNRAISPENLTKLVVYWYLTLQGDLHGSNLMAQVTQQGLRFLATDSEYSLSEQNVTRNLTQERDQWKLPPFVRLPQMRERVSGMKELLSNLEEGWFKEAFIKNDLAGDYASFCNRLNTLKALEWENTDLQNLFIQLWHNSPSIKKGKIRILPHGRFDGKQRRDLIILGPDTILDTDKDSYEHSKYYGV